MAGVKTASTVGVSLIGAVAVVAQLTVGALVCAFAVTSAWAVACVLYDLMLLLVSASVLRVKGLWAFLEALVNAL